LTPMSTAMPPLLQQSPPPPPTLTNRESTGSAEARYEQLVEARKAAEGAW
jgi:hypothetical protein